MNISEMRKAFATAADTLDRDGNELVSNSTVIGYLMGSGAKMKSILYDGGFYTRSYYMYQDAMYLDEVTGLLFDRDITQLDKDKMFAYYAFLKQNRMLKVAAIAYQNVLSEMLSSFARTSSSNYFVYIESKETPEHRADYIAERFRSASCIEMSKAYFINAISTYNRIVKQVEVALQGSNTEKRGLTEYYELKPGKPFADAETIKMIRDQIDTAYLAMPSNGLTSRTWGFELEIADAKGVDAPFNIDKGEDGSLRSYESSDDCDCDCEDCTYHDCDCDWCDNRNTDPDHCGNSSCTSADSAEFRSKNGISRLKHAGLFKLCRELDYVSAEVNDTCGVHIHVYAADLLPEQVANVLASYKWLENILAIVANRDDTSYARRLTVKDIVTAFRDKKFNATKQQAVNVMHMGMQGDRGTIEFRQMLGNYNAERITVWAWLVRGLVETAKRGAKLHHFKGVTSVNGIIEVFAKFNYYLHDEGTQLLIPGGRLDNKYIKTNNLQRAGY